MTTRYRWTLLRAGGFRLDGGSMFGLIPRAVWSRSATPDDKGRIQVQHNCLLLERLDDVPPDCALPAPKLVLIEAGSGDKLAPKDREIFDLEDRSVETALREVGCDPTNIGAAVVSHLHFDHAGGLTRLARAGEKPDWTGPGQTFGGSREEIAVCRTCPDALVFTQARELVDARANRSVMTRTYFPDNLEPLKDHFRPVESPRAWPLGATPDKADVPPVPQHARETEIMPGIFVFLAPGHTWGQQAVRFVDDRGRHVVFTPDCLPTAWHVGQAYSLAYDVEPYTSMLTRTWLLREAAERDWVLCLDHEPGEPMRRVRPNTKGWYELTEL